MIVKFYDRDHKLVDEMAVPDDAFSRHERAINRGRDSCYVWYRFFENSGKAMPDLWPVEEKLNGTH